MSVTTNPKFYHAENSNRTIMSRGIGFQFDPYMQHGGTWFGLFETDKPEFIGALDELVSQNRTAITEISKEEFERKKKPLPPSLTGKNLSHLPSSTPAQIKGESPAVVKEGKAPMIEDSKAQTIDDILTLGVVKPFAPLPPKRKGRPEAVLED